MAQRKPRIGVVVSPDLLLRIESEQKRARRTSQSEFCALLLEYAVGKLEIAGSVDALDFVETTDRKPTSLQKRGNAPSRVQMELRDIHDAADEGSEQSSDHESTGVTHGTRGKGKGKRR